LSAALEFLRTKDSDVAPPPPAVEDKERNEENDGGEGDENDEQDLSEAGADWLSGQGFEPLER